MEIWKHSKLIMLAAFGTGASITAAVLIYTYYREEAKLIKRIDNLSSHIDQLRREVEEIKITSQKHLSHNLSWEPRLHKDGNNHCQDKTAHDNRTPSSENDEFYDFIDGDMYLIKNETHEQCTRDNLNLDKDDNDKFNNWLKKFDDLLDNVSTDKNLLIVEIREGEKIFSQVPDILWRKAKVTHLLTNSISDKESKKKLHYEAFEYAKSALEKDDTNPEIHKWYAITLGSLSDYLGSKDKIQNGRIFKEHVDLAIKLNPHDATLYHLLGRWSLSVASLSWIEKQIASTLYSKIPNATYDDALSNFMRAYDLNPSWKENILFICETLFTCKNYKEGLTWIQKGLTSTIISEEDKAIHHKMMMLHKKYSTYI